MLTLVVLTAQIASLDVKCCGSALGTPDDTFAAFIIMVIVKMFGLKRHEQPQLQVMHANCCLIKMFSFKDY